ncbi:MAG TPA: glycosyltransferase family 9 protein [Candidatus Sulfotelmatobacter sp.]|nr:glycosyltransferase family 9 protein [Candidatus Sulfotelmatobacter sp.]
MLLANLKSILIIKPSSLGDVVHTLPAVALLRDAHPHAEISWVINREFAPLLRGNSDVNHVQVFPRREFRGLGAAGNLFRWWKAAKLLRPDLALDFQGLLRSALIARISGAREIYGMSDGREGSRWFYHRVARVDRHAHAVERYIKLAECAGATVGDSLRWPIPTGDPLPRFDDYPPFILLHPFARGGGKSLSNAVIQEFCRAFSPTRVVTVGQSQHKIEPPENCIELTNQTSLLQLIWLIRAARFVVSVDSGPMHIAAAVTDNLLSIHTWTDPRLVGPYNPDAWVWKNGQLFRVSELGAAKIKRRGRRFKPKDVLAVAELIRPLVPVDPMLA